MTRKSIILHDDSLDILEDMSDQQAGILFKAIKFYRKTGELPKLDFGLKIAITPFINQFKRDDKKYLMSEISGKIGNLKKYHKEIYQKYVSKEISLEEAEAEAYPHKNEVNSRPPIAPNRPRSLNVSDNVSDNVNVNVSVNDSIKGKSEKPIIPNFIKADLWNEYLKTRKKQPTDYAIKLIVNKFNKWKDEGLDPNDSLSYSIENGYTGLFEPKKTKQSSSSRAQTIMEMKLS